jgi:hypothetical protein
LIDQLIIGNKASYDDFEASVKERKDNKPKKKSIKETVPFSNVTYDFTAINGEIYWEERTLEYVFEITANTPEELEEKKQLFTSWIMNVMNEELHDPFIHGYHFIATFDSIDIDDSEVEKSTIKVVFTAYPYMIANMKKTHNVDLEAEEEITVKILNDSSHRITPVFISNVAFSLTMNGATYSFNAGTTEDKIFMFAVGENTVTVQARDKAGTLKIEFFEEVF